VNSTCNILLSFDVDRTLVDRCTALHTVHPKLKGAICDLAAQDNVRVVLNTGRDHAALAEFDREWGGEFDAIYLSGRALRIAGKVTPIAEAVLGESVLNLLLVLASTHAVPFLDIKSALGVTQVKLCRSELHFGVQKPRDWLSPAAVESIDFDSIEDLTSRLPLRIEFPLPKLVVNEVLSILTVVPSIDVSILDIHQQHRASDRSLEAWSFVQILSLKSKHNKATGLSQFIDNLPNLPRIVHFGDSLDGHNNDAVVSALLPDATFVPIDWKVQGIDQVLDSFIDEIRRYSNMNA
jgi:hydroxymethylpyrimidine pyrophosphatase-like HAD family hydrolase